MEDQPDKQVDKGVEGKLAELRSAFRQELPTRIAEIERQWTLLCDQGVSDRELAGFRGRLHSLAGSSGTFGAMIVSKVAQAMERELDSLPDSKPALDESRRNIINSLMYRLRNVADNWQVDSGPMVSPVQQQQYTLEFNNLVYVIDDDVLVAQELQSQLQTSGYQVRNFQYLDEFKRHCLDAVEQVPGIIIMDLMFREGGIAGAQVIEELRNEWKSMPPVIFISVRDDAEARLATVRSGGKRYFTKPLDYTKLVQTLDGLTGRLIKTPFRVMVVDDDESMLDFYAAIFSSQGLRVKTLANPMLALQVMDDFQPELIILDVYMPFCTGLELAAMIRQDDRWSQVPIVFISSETDLGKQMAAMGLGGDDFISKPVDETYLFASVLARLKRARWIGRLNRELREALQESQYYRVALDSHGIVSVFDPQGVITAVNDRFCELSGYTRDELIGNAFEMINSGHHDVEFFSVVWESIAQGRIWNGVINSRSKQGRYWWAETTIVPFMDEHGQPYQCVCVQTDITRLIQAREDSNHAKQEAEYASRAKSKFLSSMSHELRTPLNSILGFAQILQTDDEAPLTQDQASSVDEIEKAGQHLLDLINELLDLSRIEAGKIDIFLDDIPLQQLLEECISLIGPVLPKYQVTMRPIETDCQGMLIRADYIRIKQVLLNLLSNACKYNRAGGSIAIKCLDTGNGRLRIEVSDTGRGIATEEIGKLFSSFTRLGEELDGIEGTGIGLVISKQLTELMGGRIGVESEHGKGSVFWLELPQGEGLA